MNKNRIFLPAAVLLASLLAACGGAGDDPDPTNLPSAFTVSGASNSAINGAYANPATPLSGVNKLERLGASDACEFSFENVGRTGGGFTAKGSVQYIVDTNNLHRLVVEIDGVRYEASPIASGTSVSRSTNSVSFTGVVLPSGSQAITVTGFLPMRSDRPAGC